MRIVLVIMFLAITASAQESATTVRDAACGPLTVKLDVKRDSSRQPLPRPEPGKALVYFIQDIGLVRCLGACITTNIGIDGAWVGADQHNSYFFVSLAPGEHHLCANRQSHFEEFHQMIALAHFTAEAGKTYYFRTRTFGDKYQTILDLDLIDSDEGRYLVASYPLSVSHAKK